MRHLPHLRQSLAGLGVLVLGAQFALARADEAFDESGQLKDARAARSVKNLVADLIEVARNVPASRG